MDKILTLFKREYRAAVRTKSFLISLILVPIMMGGGFLADKNRYKLSAIVYSKSQANKFRDDG